MRRPLTRALVRSAGRPSIPADILWIERSHRNFAGKSVVTNVMRSSLRAGLLALLLCLVVVPAGVAGTRYVVSSLSQIKPSVQGQLRGRLQTVDVYSAYSDLCPLDDGGMGCSASASARCPRGYLVTGGGLAIPELGDAPRDATLVVSNSFGGSKSGGYHSLDDNGWQVGLNNQSDTDGGYFQAEAICSRIS